MWSKHKSWADSFGGLQEDMVNSTPRHGTKKLRSSSALLGERSGENQATHLNDACTAKPKTDWECTAKPKTGWEWEEYDKRPDKRSPAKEKKTQMNMLRCKIGGGFA
jgi:hypothetical protein